MEADVKKLRRDLVSLKRNDQDKQLRITRLQEQASVFWQNAENPHAEIAGKLDKVARQATVALQNVGAPGESKISEVLGGTEISLQFTGSMHEVARFFAALETARPRFFWRSFTITPDNARAPKKVSLSGKLMLITLSGDASKLLEKGSGTP